MTAKRTQYTAIVTNVDDDEKRGRIRFKSQDLLPEGEEYPYWAEPCFPYAGEGDAGWFFVPDVGQSVTVSIITDSGDDDSPGESLILSGGRPQWNCALYNTTNAVPEEFDTNYPRRQGIKTPSGNLLMFDDTDGARKVLLRHGGTSGDGKGGFFAIEPDGSIVIGTQGGQMLYLNESDGKVTILDKNTNMINMDNSAVTIASNGHMIVLDSGGVFVTAAGNCTVTANDVSLKAGTIQLGDDPLGLLSEAVVKGETFQTLFNAHTHAVPGIAVVTTVTGGTPAAPPTPITGAGTATGETLIPTQQLTGAQNSTKVKTI